MKGVVWCTIFVVALFGGKYARALVEDESGHYVNEVAVLLDGDETVADLVAGTHGFTVKRKVSVLCNLCKGRNVTLSRTAHVIMLILLIICFRLT